MSASSSGSGDVKWLQLLCAFEEPQSHTLLLTDFASAALWQRTQLYHSQFQEPTTSSTSVSSDTLPNLCLPGRLSHA